MFFDKTVNMTGPSLFGLLLPCGLSSFSAAALLSERNVADKLLREEIGRKTADCISVKSVEIRDVAIPVALQDAMSRQAQAERE